jgi:RimJ/RimL family protein N-acetyltransferase
MIIGEKVLLRAVEERDLAQLASWRNDPQNRRFVFTPFLINPCGQKKWFEALLANPNKVLFMVDNCAGKTVGMIGADHIDWRNQECEGGPIVFDFAERSHGYAEEAMALLFRYVFEELNMHRIYATCYTFNPVVELMKWFGIQEEGILSQAAYTQGCFHDKVILALLRDEWQALWGETKP